MIDEAVRTCNTCGRLIVPGQTVCACGTRVSLEPLARPKRSIDYGIALPWIPLVGGLGLLYLILNPTLVMFTSMPILKIVAITIIASAALALLVADRARKQDWVYANSPLSNFSPTSWFASVLVLWPFFFPGFLHAHYQKSNPTRMIFGFLTTAFFLVMLIWLLIASRNALPEWPIKRPANEAAPVSSNVPAQTPAPPPDVLQLGGETVPDIPTPADTIVLPPVTDSSSGASSSGSGSTGQPSATRPNPQPAPSAPSPAPPQVPQQTPPDSTKNRFPMFSVPIINVKTKG